MDLELALAFAFLSGALVGMATDMVTVLLGLIFRGKPWFSHVFIGGVGIGSYYAHSVFGSKPEFAITLVFAIVGGLGCVAYQILRDELLLKR